MERIESSRGQVQVKEGDTRLRVIKGENESMKEECRLEELSM